MKIAKITTLAGLAAATPTPTVNKDDKRTIQKRATITEACDIGFASSNGGTTGGAGGTTTTVTDFASFSEAADVEGPLVIVVEGDLTGPGRIRPESDKTIVGASGGASLTNIGIYIRQVSNVIVRNLAVGDVDADNGDAIGVDESTNVWIDHVNLSGSLDVGKDDYDGLFDVKHAADWVTISNSILHDSWKSSLIGNSDSNGDEDEGHLTVTYANNYWHDVNSRTPSVRFGTVHIYNCLYETVLGTGVNTRMGAQVLIESTAFVDTEKPVVALYSDETGYAVLNDVDLGGASIDVPEGTISGDDLPYSYELVGSGNLESALADVGTTLSWD